MTTAPELSVPDLHCPFPPAAHPDSAVVEEDTVSWLKKYEYVPAQAEEASVRAARFGLLAGMAYPVGRVEAVQFGSDLMAWLFLSDDVKIEEPGEKDNLPEAADHILHSMRILHDPHDLPPEPTRHQFALQDLSTRLRELATAEQLDRFIGGMGEYFRAASCEAMYLARGIVPPLRDYVALRDSSIATRSVCFLICELAGEYELPGPVWCRPDLQAVVRSATRIVSDHHDILSGMREWSRETVMNLPSALARHHGITPAEAIKRAAHETNTEMRRFVSLSERLLATDPGKAVENYVDGLKAWIKGNHDWSQCTGRYDVAQYR